MDSISTQFSGLAQNCERRLVRVGTTMVGGIQATERRVKNTAGERNGCKTKHCWGLSVAIEKWSRTPTLSKLTHMIIDCRAALIEKWCGHDYFLRRPRAGRLRPSVSHSRGLGSVGWSSKGCTGTPTLAGWCSRCCVDGVFFGWCSKTLSQNPRWGGVSKVGVVLQKAVPESSMGWCFKSWGGAPKRCPRMAWCSKSLGGVPKSCPRIPTARWADVPKVGVVFQKVVPESPLCILLTCALGAF